MLKHLAPVALIMLAIISYFVLAMIFGIYQAVPWPHYLLALVGCVLLGRLALQQRQLRPWLATATGSIFTALFVWYTLVYSAYEPRQLAVQEAQVVAELADLQLPDQDGNPVGLFDGTSQATLLVFYRGYW